MPKSPDSEGSRLITLKQIELEHGISRSALHTYRRSASFPQPVSVEGSTKIQYRADEVAAWFEANPPQQGKRTDLTDKQQGDPVTTTVDPRTAALTEAVDALQAKAQEVSTQAEQEMRRDLEEKAQVWHEAADLVARLARKGPTAAE